MKLYLYTDNNLDVRFHHYTTKRHMMNVINNLIRFCDKVEVRDEFNRIVAVVKF